MAKDALTAHARDELGISEITTARPVQAALTSAATFSVGAAMPLLMVVLSPAAIARPDRLRRSLGFLALLGAIGARAGGRKYSARDSPSDILGRLGDGSNRRYRGSFRRGCLTIWMIEGIQKNAHGHSRNEVLSPPLQIFVAVEKAGELLFQVRCGERLANRSGAREKFPLDFCR